MTILHHAVAGRVGFQLRARKGMNRFLGWVYSQRGLIFVVGNCPKDGSS